MIRNHKGMSLVTVLVGVAIVGVMMTGMMAVIKNSMDMYHATKLREDADSMRFIASVVLQDSDACRRSLLGSGLNLNQIESANGGECQFS